MGSYPIHHLLMLFATHRSQLLHIAQDSHLGSYLHELEVVECCSHARRVGIVGIDDEVVVGCLLQLRTVVGGGIVAQSLVDLGLAHTEVESDGDGCQHVEDIVTADELRLYLLPCASFGLPTEMQEWGAMVHPSQYLGRSCCLRTIGHLSHPLCQCH